MKKAQEYVCTKVQHSTIPNEGDCLTRKDEILIDQIILSNVRIIEIMDTEDLFSQGIIKMDGSDLLYHTVTGQSFTVLHIADDVVTDFIAKAVKKHGAVHQFSTMIVSVKTDDTYGNLQCYRYGECWEHLLEIQAHLAKAYGIIITYDIAKIKSIELNKTFPLKYKFTDYRRPLSYLMRYLSTTLNNQMDCHNRLKDYSAYYATTKRKPKSKNYLDLKFYDKTKALNLDIDASYMRIELTFVGSTKIKREFGTNLFLDFSDALISRVYQSAVDRYIQKPLDEAQKKRYSRLSRILKNEHKKGDNGWITKVLRCIMNTEIEENTPFLLDIHELFPFLESLTDSKGTFLSSSRKYKIRESFILHAEAYEKAFCKKDHEKLMELLERIVPNTIQLK